MEFLDGRSLREVLDSGVALPPERIAGIAAQLAADSRTRTSTWSCIAT